MLACSPCPSWLSPLHAGGQFCVVVQRVLASIKQCVSPIFAQISSFFVQMCTDNRIAMERIPPEPQSVLQHLTRYRQEGQDKVVAAWRHVMGDAPLQHRLMFHVISAGAGEERIYLFMDISRKQELTMSSSPEVRGVFTRYFDDLFKNRILQELQKSHVDKQSLYVYTVLVGGDREDASRLHYAFVMDHMVNGKRDCSLQTARRVQLEDLYVAFREVGPPEDRQSWVAIFKKIVGERWQMAPQETAC